MDKRTDVWAFGCVLFEMLSGRTTFVGDTVSDTIATILTREPAWDRLPDATPPEVRRLLRRCLQKDPKQRLRDIGDVRIELDEALTGARPDERAGRQSPSSRAGRRSAPLPVSLQVRPQPPRSPSAGIGALRLATLRGSPS